MDIIEVILISIGLAMDAFAVAICKGLSMRKINYPKAIIIGLYFGTFQAVMPVLGYFLGSTFGDLITCVDHWVAFALLTSIGVNMIKEGLSKDTKAVNDKTDVKTMIPLAVATSIDALAVGITFACLKVEIVLPAILIGIITFTISVLGVKIGNKFGNKYQNKAQIAGGIILILLAIKTLIEHLCKLPK